MKTSRKQTSRKHTSRLLLAIVAVVALANIPATPANADPTCTPGMSAVACENLLPGSPASAWDVGDGDANIEGYATDISVNVGGTARFKVNTSAPTFQIDIFRMGYYQGNGARKIATIGSVAGRNQPSCLSDPTTGLVDCGNWSETGSWPVPSTAVSGVYMAVITRLDNQDKNMIPFIVRNDASHADLVFQTSDTTWQAYNSWGGNSFYKGNPAGRAYKLSYNRPFNTRSGVPQGRDFLFSNEYPMIRYLERNGYDLSYQSGVDTDRLGSLLTNHKTFLSVGHDEYWSGDQRTNVEAARDAGVNLAFFSGNEVYWKTRYEPSIDGSGTADRTLVTYKETWANGKIDPTAEWTGTWRDPRFSPPADGGKPENALTGTWFMVNCCNSTMTVPAEDGKMRFWRNTAAASQSTGQSLDLDPNALGYEFDETPDNGFQPAGLVPLSSTTLPVQEYLQDYGSTVLPGTATHHLALHRVASGALVFGAGTVQWAWGLDAAHDGPANPADITMQQATMNLLADMDAQPTTPQNDLTPTPGSTDVAAPTATITAPANGATIAGGAVYTITGTATDAGGGKVGAVEVSTDNGTTWHPATGRGTWSYAWSPNGVGNATIRVRATDDSGNIQSTPAAVTVTQRCPCSLLAGKSPGIQAPSTDVSAVSVGTKVRADQDGWIAGIRFYKEAANTGTHTASLWTTTGTRLATGTFTNETPTGWQTLTFAQPVPISANTTYIASYFAPQGHYTATSGYFTNSVDVAPLHAPSSATSGGNGVYLYGSDGLPTDNYGAANYWVDPIFITTPPNDTTKPTAQAVSPPAGATGISVNTTAVASFSEPVQSGTIQFTLTPSVGPAVAGTVAYDNQAATATFTPSAPLAINTTYTARVAGAKDAAGNQMATALTWTFTTANNTVGCPCTIFGTTAPAVPAVVDPSAVTLGVKIRSDIDGWISGVRFYKGTGNGGTHTGSLWSESGTRLATGTFTGESATGWQTLTFSQPVPVAANTTYVASYFAPQGNYAATAGAFANAVDTPPLHALANSTSSNGVYLYGSDGFPNQSYGASNYWVDATLTLAAPADTTPPTASVVTPTASATNVSVTTKPVVQFSEPVQTGTIGFTLTSAAGPTVPGTMSYDSGTQQATFTPTANLAPSTTFTARVAGVKDTAGNQIAAPLTWTFTTAADATGCPCTLFGATAPAVPATSDSSGVTVGVKLTSDVNGWISGVRFYKGAGNGGTHTGSLWSSTGTRLATGTFSNESATGWQTLTFNPAVAITANTTYIASYYAPQGHYAATGGAFSSQINAPPLHALADGSSGGNGVYLYGSDGFPNQSYGASNYWVDATLQLTAPVDTALPTATIVSPASNAQTVPVTTSVVIQFSEPVQPATISFSLTPFLGSAVAGTTTYDPQTLRATFKSTAALTTSWIYTAKVQGAKDLAGNTMSGNVSWNFNTSADASGCPCNLFGTAVPSTPAANDAAGVALGTRFTSDVAGKVTGVRFYKGSGNGGTHTGSLWSSTGTRLATGTFTGESATGWQTLTFNPAVAITANTTYVVSYYAPQGHYASTGGYFNTKLDVVPLHAPANATGAGNGLYLYGSDGFPTNTFGASNYWVDPVFVR